jgi:hypothetical protein
MERGLNIKYLYHDDDILEIQVSAFDGQFAGVTALYVARDELRQSADSMQGFPTSRADEREVTWGAFGPEIAGGAARLKINCIDSALHVRVSIQIEDADAMQSAVVIAVLEPAAIDNFIPQLRRIDEELGGEATLEFSR